MLSCVTQTPPADPDLVTLIKDDDRLVTPAEAAQLTRDTFQGLIMWRPSNLNVAILRPFHA